MAMESAQHHPITYPLENQMCPAQLLGAQQILQGSRRWHPNVIISEKRKKIQAY